jgi:hypothetical protein
MPQLSSQHPWREVGAFFICAEAWEEEDAPRPATLRPRPRTATDLLAGDLRPASAGKLQLQAVWCYCLSIRPEARPAAMKSRLFPHTSPVQGDNPRENRDFAGEAGFQLNLGSDHMPNVIHVTDLRWSPRPQSADSGTVPGDAITSSMVACLGAGWGLPGSNAQQYPGTAPAKRGDSQFACGWVSTSGVPVPASWYRGFSSIFVQCGW